MTELIPDLYIGNWHEARAAKGSMHIVTVASDSEFVGDQHFKLVDGPGNSVLVFREAVEAVYAAHRSGKKVLVHCVGGRSRSAAVIVAAATKLTGKHFCEVYDELLRRHDGAGTGARIHPHLSVMLLEYV
jgi:protein-tyrosine phosphatase